MTESLMRRQLCKDLKDCHAVGVENVLARGTPDVSMVGCWIELKQLPCWPVRPRTIVKVPKFTNYQRAWLARHVLAGGKAFVLLRVRCEWLLFFATEAVRHLGRSTRWRLEKSAVVRVERSQSLPSEIVCYLRARSRPQSG